MPSDLDPSTLVTPDELDRLRATVAAGLPAYLDELAALVAIDSGSGDLAGLEQVAVRVVERLRALGARVEVERDPVHGPAVVGRFGGPARQPGEAPILLVGHLDTVYPAGTAAHRPFEIRDGRALGPGVADDKGGLLAGLAALAALRALGERGSPTWPLPVTVVANPDEEVGSPASTPIIARLAAEHAVCLVLECARANGDIVSARKGNLHLRIDLQGRAAHAGVEPEKGRSAVLAAAGLVVALHGLSGRWPGVTVNVGVIEGGTRPNVVPERARLEVDVRAADRASLVAAEAEIRRLAAAPSVPDVEATVTELARHWPMERLPATDHLVRTAAGLARRLGFPLRDAATGGASDGNTTAGLGLPTLDGLGPIGGGDHSPEEYLEVDSVAPRTTLLAALVLALARDPTVAAWRAADGDARSGEGPPRTNRPG
ncbi:MAG TPA: M20 family metallopeptidase [Candidatus Binatia bacterium]|nr:M20 family metallopeptidase [Candidatus Binatia bacterium]